MASGGSLVRTQSFTPPKDAPAYLVDALRDIGLQEWVMEGRSKVSNPVVERYIEKVQGKPANARTTPWCAYFVGAKLEYNGITSTKSGMARSYMNWGVAVPRADWRAGDLVVFWRGDHDDHITGHIGFLLKWDEKYLYVLGGNQGDKVCIQTFTYAKFLGVRRARAISKTIVASTGSGTAQVANKGVENFIPDAPPVSHDLVAGHMPSPDDLQAAYDQAHPYMSMLIKIKPELMFILTVVSIGLALYAAYFRYMDWKKGRT